MFLFLSKILLVFLAPANWIIGLLIIRLLIVRHSIRRRLLVCALFIFIVFSNKAIYHSVINAWQPKPVDIQGKQYEAGILLGGITSFDKNGKGFFAEASDRFIQADLLYTQGVIKKLIVTGGRISGELPKEATFLQQKLIESGVKAQDIIVEDQSKNTFENAMFTKRILDSKKVQGPFLLITSAFHIPRAIKVFERAGIKVIPYPCDYKVINSKLSLSDFFWPNLQVLTAWQIIFKEWVGLFVYDITGKA